MKSVEILGRKFVYTTSIVLALIILIMTGCSKGQNDQNLSETESTVAEDTESSTEKVSVDMSVYQSKLNQWKERFSGYGLEGQLQSAYAEVVENYQTAINNCDEEECDQCENLLDTLLTQAENEKFQEAKLKSCYAGIVNGVKYSFLPDCDNSIERFDSYGDETEEDDEYVDKYAILDVDSDGRKELIISVTDTVVAGMLEMIYEFNPETNELKQELATFPANTYYDNGVVKSGWSHNQGMGPDFWPFDLYVYDGESDTYIGKGSVDTWDKQYFPEDYEGSKFPDELDSNGDGVLYYLMDEDGNGWDTLHDNADYDAWYQAYIGDAKEIEIPWKTVSDNECEGYTKEYISLVIEKIRNNVQEGDTDIGLILMEGENDYENYGAVEEVLVSQFQMSIENDHPDGLIRKGRYDGKTVYYTYEEDGGGIAYCNERVENLTLLGLYPGMTEEDAITHLKEIGFYGEDDWGYYTGDDFGNYRIILESENGIVKQITLYPYTRFAG